MTEMDYLRQLRTHLAGNVKAAELERIMEYYTALFREDVRPDGEIIAELGAPEELAARLLGREAPTQAAQTCPPGGFRERTGAGQAWEAALCLLLFFAEVTVCVLTVSFLVSGVAIMIGGALFAIRGIGMMLLWFGGGVALLGLGLLLLPAAVGLGTYLVRRAGAFFRRSGGNKEGCV